MYSCTRQVLSADQVRGSPDKTEVRGESLNIVRGQFARNAGHGRRCGRVITFAPLLESPFQVVVRQASQARNFSKTLSIGAMTSNAGRDIGDRDSLLIYRLSCSCEPRISVIRSFNV